jgi:hypothetical protein
VRNHIETLSFFLLLLIAPVNAWSAPIRLDFDSLPGSEWGNYNDGGSASVLDGILTISTPSYYEFIQSLGPWHDGVDNSKGWVIETRLKLDPSSDSSYGCNFDRGTVQIWAHDHTNLVIIGFDTKQICLASPDNVRVSMNTTDDFHVYRIESQGRNIKIYADGRLVIDHVLSWSGGGSNILMFGDGVGGTRSLSYWDYFWYDVDPSVTGPVAQNINIQGVTGESIVWQPIVSSPAGGTSVLTCRLGMPPANGNATIAANCSSGTYQSHPGFIGTDTFTYLANDGKTDSNPGTVTVAVTEPQGDPACLKQYPVTQFSQTGKQGTITVTLTGHITSHTNKEVKVCPGTTLSYQFTSTQGPVVCKVKNSATRGSGSLQINDHLKCTDKPAGQDKVHFKVKSGVK